ncbi:MAG: sugar ABC transporter ATP-binding protein [Chloroflexota bacterium]
MDEKRAPLLEMRNISKSFFGVPVLQAINFDLYPGEVHVLLGENGAGKSTLMKILSAAYRLDSGQILIDGQEQHFKVPADAQTVGISTIYQHFNQCLDLTIAENIFLGRPPRTRFGLIDWRQMNRDAQAALSNVNTNLDARTRIGTLSIASRQVVEIVSAINRRTRILVMDEPTAALSEQEVKRLFELIRSLTERGVGVIYISHRMEELQSIGDRVTVLRDGRNTGTHKIAEMDLDSLVRLMIGRDLNQTNIAPLPDDMPETLRVENLTRKGKFQSVSFSVRQGEIVGISGLMGSGRTELAQSIFGVHPLTSGEIYIRGQRVNIRIPGDAVKLGIGFLTEDRLGDGLGASLSIRDNMSLPLWASGQEYVYGLFLNRRKERQLSNEYSRRLNVRATNMSMPVRYLSGGNQQKVVLAKWLIARCSILIVDEPTAGIDIGAKEEVHRLLINFTRQEGGTVIMISSDLPEILKLSDRILVMAKGHMVKELNRAEATEEIVMGYSLTSIKG